MNHGVFKEKNENSAFCTKIWSRGGQDAQNETCARLSRSNQNENLDKFACSRLVRKLACKNQRVRKLVCLVGFLAFFGLFLNSQNNLFAGEPHTVTKNGSYYYDEQGLRYSISNSVATVARYSSVPASGKITIPNEISYTGNNITPTIYPVTAINADAFMTSTAQANLKEVDASGCTNLQTIGDNAFRECKALATANFSGCINLDTIGNNAFYQCEALQTADFSGCTNLQTIGQYAFYGCKALQTANFSGFTNLHTIDQCAFYGCKALQTANFSGCTNLDTIGNNAFYGCKALQTADFSGCTNLDTIGQYAFRDCYDSDNQTGLTTADFSDCYYYDNTTQTATGLQTMGNGAFYGCEALQTADFSGCTNLDIIGQYAFYGCKALQTADFSGCTNLQTIDIQAFYQCEALPTADFSGCTNLDIIGQYAFRECKALATANFSGCINLDTIDIMAFYQCEALTTANFSGCTNLSELNILLFYNCPALTTADFSGCINLKTIGTQAFYNCSKAEVILESGAFSATDSSIATDAFSLVKRVTVLGGDNSKISGAVSYKKVTFNQLLVDSYGNLTTKTVMVQYVKSSNTGNYVKDPSQPAYTYTNADGEEATRNYQYTDNRTVKNYGSFWRLPSSTTAFVFGGDAGTSGTGFTDNITLIDQRAVVFDANDGTFAPLDSTNPYVTTSEYNYFNKEMTTYTTFAYQNSSNNYVIFRPLENDVVSRTDYDCLGYAATNNAAAALDDAGMISYVTTAFSSKPPPAAVTFYTVWDPVKYTVIQIVNGEEEENDVLLPDDSVTVGDSEDVPGLLYWQVVDASGNSVDGAPTIAGDTTIAYGDLATDGEYNEYIVTTTGGTGEETISIRCLKLVAAVQQHKIVEFKLQKTFASGGPQFFAAIGKAAGEQSPQQSITEFLKSNVVANMFDVKRAASSSVKEGEETSLTNKTTALAAKEDDLGYYVITDVAYTDGSNSFTVTFNVVVPVGDTSGEIRLRENEKCINGLFTATYNNNAENTYCAVRYANLTE